MVPVPCNFMEDKNPMFLFGTPYYTMLLIITKEFD